MILGITLMLAVGLWWYAIVLWRNPQVLDAVARRSHAQGRHSRRGGLVLQSPGHLPAPVPMVLLFRRRDDRRRHRVRAAHERGVVLMVLLVVVPVVLMSFARDRRERYLCP